MAVGRRLLEWTTAAQAAYLQSNWRTLVRQLAGSSIFGIAALIAIPAYGQDCWPVAVPFIAMWAISPLLARWASETPALAEHMAMSAAERQELRLVARRTWRFFETFITADNHMLPPDNFQEDPKPVVARRTSRPLRQCATWSVFAVTFIIGTTLATFGHLNPNISLQSIAAIWPATWWHWGTLAGS
jgi:cyclic beta-1,2-glucan synthetase